MNPSIIELSARFEVGGEKVTADLMFRLSENKKRTKTTPSPSMILLLAAFILVLIGVLQKRMARRMTAK